MAPALAKGPVFDVVFDLDWTLFYPSKTGGGKDSVRVGEDSYRLADGVVQVIAQLHKDGHRVSLFSGGLEGRNRILAQFLLEKMKARGVEGFSFYKVLSAQDLRPRPGAASDARFAERFMKDLSLVNPDLKHVVLVDDMAKFSVLGQEKNMYFLGQTYTFYENYDPAAKGPYDPPSEAEWHRERHKLLTFHQLFKAAISGAGGDDVLIRLQALRDGRGLCSQAFGS